MGGGGIYTNSFINYLIPILTEFWAFYAKGTPATAKNTLSPFLDLDLTNFLYKPSKNVKSLDMFKNSQLLVRFRSFFTVRGFG